MKHTLWLAVVLGCGIAGPTLTQCEPQKLLASNGGKHGRFGWSVAVHERIAAISGSKDRVYVYDLRTGLERFQVGIADAPGSSQDFGMSVDISEKWLIVGAPGDFEEGSASVFDLSTGLEVYQFRASNANWCDWFGMSVALDGDIALIGAPGVTGCGIEGRAFVFDLTTGKERLELTLPGNVSLAWDVDIDGNRGLLVEFDRAHLFDLTTGKRILELIPTAGAFDCTTQAAIEGNVAVVGDPCDATLGSYAGAAYVFDTTSGQELFKLLGSDWKAGDEFGSGVALHGDLVLLGAHRATQRAISASLFNVRSGLEIARVTAAGVEPQDGFGGSLALGKDWMLIAADSDDELGDYAGAAYLYKLRSSPDVSSYCVPANFNSTGQSASASAASRPLFCDKLYLLAEYLPPHQVGYFLTSMTQGFTPFAGGSQGNLCLAGSIGRFIDQVRNSGSNGAFNIVADTTALPQPSGDVGVQPGETWNFQAWYRDMNPGPTSNFTDAVSVLFK